MGVTAHRSTPRTLDRADGSGHNGEKCEEHGAMAMDPTADIKVGTSIFTRDGEPIGSVGELQGDYIKVNVALQPDYWVRRSSVLSFTIDRVTLDVDRDGLDEHKVDGPE